MIEERGGLERGRERERERERDFPNEHSDTWGQLKKYFVIYEWCK
jgi:hypothetical protein